MTTENSETKPAPAEASTVGEVTMPTEGFEIDRTATGKVRVNVVSLANLLALVGLIGTAMATWNSLTSKVDMMSVRVDSAMAAAAQLRSDMGSVALSREAGQRDLTSKVELIGNRLVAVETVLQRLERKLEK